MDLQLSVAGISSALNYDSHLMLGTTKLGNAIRPLWFMMDLGQVRRYVKGTPKASDTKYREKGFVMAISQAKQLKIPEALLKHGSALSNIWVMIDITKDKQAHAFPFAECPEIGSISNLNEANAVSIQCVTELPAGWIGAHVLNSNIRHQSCGADNWQVPSNYINSMLIINTLERRQFLGDIPKQVKVELLGMILMETKYSWLENKLALSFVLGPVDKQPVSAPVPVTMEANKAILQTQFPSLVFGAKPDDLGLRPINATTWARPRSRCDMCYVVSLLFELSSASKVVGLTNVSQGDLQVASSKSRHEV